MCICDVGKLDWLFLINFQCLAIYKLPKATQIVMVTVYIVHTPLATAYNRIVKKYRLREMQELSMGIWDDDISSNIVIIDDDESCIGIYIKRCCSTIPMFRLGIVKNNL